MSGAFINVTSSGDGRASIDLHHNGDIIDITHLVASITWVMDAERRAQLTLVTTSTGRVELEAAIPEGFTVIEFDPLKPSAEECPVHQRP